MPEWGQRAERAHNNLKDYFPSFAVAVLLLMYFQIADTLTLMACILFVVFRIIHFIGYCAGSVQARASAWFVAMIANLYLYVVLSAHLYELFVGGL